MPRFDVRCEQHGVREIVRKMSEEGPFVCDLCGEIAQWIVTPFFFQEDRMRLWRNPVDGSRFSYALGAQMPDSVRERDRLAEQRGVEFCSAGEFLRDNKEAADAVRYREHVATGGKRDPWEHRDSDSWRSSNPKVKP